MLPNECTGCLNKIGKDRCRAFTDPKYQHEIGCYGRITDPDEFRQRETALREYIERYGSKMPKRA